MIDYEIPTFDELQKELDRRVLEDDLYEFLLWCFKAIKREEFLENVHHKAIADVLMKVYRGELLHVIINLPPRYTKTELVVKAFIAWCLAKNPKCRFLHLSYSDDLALENSSAIKEMITSEEYQDYWPLQLKADSKSKKKWYTLEGGGMYSAAAGGQVTGFGAGSMADNGFAGAILIDDPIKPDDAGSDTIRNAVNNRFNTTIKSRTNSKKTPIILIMQRVHEDDLSGFLLGGGSEYEFYHLNLPAMNEDGPSEYDSRERGDALWPEKHDADDLEAMRLADANTFAGQYQQRPAPEEGNIFKWFNFYKVLPEDIYYKVHSWDMTFKEKSKNKKGKVDYVVGQEWGKRRSNADIYLHPNMVRRKMGFTDTMEEVEDFYDDNPGPKAVLVEDKANGSAILDVFKATIKRMIAIEPTGSKVERAEAVAPLWKAGGVWLPHPSIAPWINDFINEHKNFPNGKFDDQVDAGTQAVEYLDNIGVSSLADLNKKKQQPFSKTFHDRRRDRKQRIKPKTY